MEPIPAFFGEAEEIDSEDEEDDDDDEMDGEVEVDENGDVDGHGEAEGEEGGGRGGNALDSYLNEEGGEEEGEEDQATAPWQAESQPPLGPLPLLGYNGRFCRSAFSATSPHYVRARPFQPWAASDKFVSGCAVFCSRATNAHPSRPFLP